MKKLAFCLVILFGIHNIAQGNDARATSAALGNSSLTAKTSAHNTAFPNIFRKIKRGFRRMVGLPVYVCILKNTPADVTALSLSREKITADDERSVEILIETYDAEKDVLTYIYTVSGGRIIGVGTKVTWDLSSLEPGTYTISASANDGLPGGKSITKVVIIE
jgi:hypothetical protein